MDTLGNRLKALRASDGRTQDEISAALKKYDIKADRVTVARWENDIQQPTLRPVKALAEIYGVSSDYIIDGSDFYSSSSASKHQIPVYKRISKDFAIGSRREIIGWEFVHSFDPNDHTEKFAFIVQDDTMQPKYISGDIVVVSSPSKLPIPPGSDALVNIGKEDAIIRRIAYLDDGGILLQTYDVSAAELSFTASEIKELPVVIRGYAIELRRSL